MQGTSSRPRPENQDAVRCLSWKPCERGTLQGFAEIYIAPYHLTIGGVGIHRHENGKTWIQLPSKPLLAPGTDELLREANGRPRYAKVLSFDAPVLDLLTPAVVAAVDRYLEGGAR